MATFVISKMAGWFKQYLIEFSRADACMIIYMNLHIYKKNRYFTYKITCTGYQSAAVCILRKGDYHGWQEVNLHVGYCPII